MPDSLIIDERSASVSLTDAQISEWWQSRRVFVSSLITDMPAERRAARETIEAWGAVPVMFEHDLGAQDVDAQQAYLSGVRTSDVYLGLWGPRYGVRLADGASATEAEFVEAEARGLRLCLFVDDSSSDTDRAQRDLIDSARQIYTTSPWSDVDDLKSRIGRRLRDIAADDLAPWVRLGRCVFRATSIENDGQAVTLTATIRSAALHAELTRMRDGQASDVAFATHQLAALAQVRAVSSRTTSTISHDETVQLTVRSADRGHTRFAMQGLSAGEVARRALADGLFGTQTLGESGWMTKPVDPLMPLRGQGIDDVVVRPVSALLIGEHLLGSGEAATVDAVDLGPSRQGQRRLRVSWTPVREYSNTPDPAPVTVEGMVTGL